MKTQSKGETINLGLYETIYQKLMEYLYGVV